MMNFWQTLEKTRIFAILRGDLTSLEKVLGALWQGGIRIVEIAANTPGVFTKFPPISQKFKGRLVLGIGTVYNLSLCQKASKACAKFIVAPNINQDVVKFCQQKKIPIIPGVMTPTEVSLAINLEIKAVKLFPASILGPQYLKQLRGPFDKVSLIPVGGINLKNAVSFFQAGAFAVGVGSSLVNQKGVREKNWGKIQKQAEGFSKLIKNENFDR